MRTLRGLNIRLWLDVLFERRACPERISSAVWFKILFLLQISFKIFKSLTNLSLLRINSLSIFLFLKRISITKIISCHMLLFGASMTSLRIVTASARYSLTNISTAMSSRVDIYNLPSLNQLLVLIA